MSINKDKGSGASFQGSGAGGQGSAKPMNIKSYRDLEVWQKAMDLVVICYKATKEFPKNEIYGLTSQLQRAAVSIPANIAEGRERQHSKEFLQHLSIAYGSLGELETLIQIAERLNYVGNNQSKQIIHKAARAATKWAPARLTKKTCPKNKFLQCNR